MGKRVYTGWKAGLSVVFAVVVFVVLMNVVGHRFSSDPKPVPDKIVTTVPPNR